MAIAKNFASHGVWGVTPDAFTSSSSSLLWTFLLSLDYRAFGANELAPLAYNALFGCALLALSFALLRQTALSPLARFAVLVAVILLTPLPTMAMLGMEHVLQAACTLWFLLALYRSVERPGARATLALGASAACLATARYEGLFFVAPAAVYLWVSRRRRDAIVAGAAAGLPLALYGAFSLARGWYPLPNSVLLKGLPPSDS